MRAVVVNPHAWVGNRGGQRTARPTRRCSKVKLNCYTIPIGTGRSGVAARAGQVESKGSVGLLAGAEPWFPAQRIGGAIDPPTAN